MIPFLLDGPLFNALSETFTIISQCFLTVLFLAFLLINDASTRTSDDDDSIRIENKIRRSVRRYIRIKTLLALALGVIVGSFYALMEVDLYMMFAIVTVVLCYIPHVGNTIAVICPLVLVFLDPEKSWGDVVTVFVVPFVIHQLSLTMIEPKWLADSLDLHPVIVLLALSFWTTIWGAAGSVLSVPVTAVLRLILLEVDHPYATPIVRLLKGQLMVSNAHTNSNNSNDISQES